MLDNAVLDTILGLAFTLYATALVCSGVVEAASNLLKKRAKYLIRGVRDLMDGQAGPALGHLWSNKPLVDTKAETALYSRTLGAAGGQAQSWAEAVLSHPLTLPYKHLTANGAVRRNPSYLPAPVFAQALLDMLPLPANQPVTPANLVASLPAGQLRSALAALAKSAGDDLDRFQRSVEGWFDGAMDRVSGSYKRWAKRWAIAVALVVVAVFQVDTIAIARALYTDGTTRAAIVQAAGSDKLCPPSGTATPSPEPSPGPTADCVPSKLPALGQAGLPVGWRGHVPGSAGAWFVKILGLLLTAAGAALGAPFWFTALNKIASLRNTGAKPASSS